MAETRLQFHPAARNEALAAYDWYSERNVDAAESFQFALENAGHLIERSPDAWAAYLHGTQKFLLKHFPFKFLNLSGPFAFKPRLHHDHLNSSHIV